MNQRRAWAQHVKTGHTPGVDARPKTFTQTRGDLEHEIQKTFIDVTVLMTAARPELGTIYAIPNGGHRHPAVGGKLKREGVRAGMPDLHLPVPRGPFASLYMETKAPGESISKSQKERFPILRKYGNVVAVCFSVDQLMNTALAYLDGAVTDEKGTIAADWRGDR